MGQYYIAVILAEDGKYVRSWLQSYDYASGSKLMEHSYLNNPFVIAVENMIGPKGIFYKSKLVWAGDYADNEVNNSGNLNGILSNETSKLLQGTQTEVYRFIVNHTKRLYIDKNSLKNDINPLPLLVSEGNGRGGGDYLGVDQAICGSWARNIMSVEDAAPPGYIEFNCNFDY
jgi:hypothetical protein